MITDEKVFIRDGSTSLECASIEKHVPLQKMLSGPYAVATLSDNFDDFIHFVSKSKTKNVLYMENHQTQKKKWDSDYFIT